MNQSRRNNSRRGAFDLFGPAFSIVFVAWFVFCALIGLGTLGVVVWAVIKLVNHFTA